MLRLQHLSQPNNAVTNTSNTPAPVTPAPTKPKDSVTKPAPAPTVVKDTTAKKPAVSYPYKWDENKEHYVAIVLEKVEGSFVNEVKNSFIVYNRTQGRVLFVETATFSPELRVVILSSFVKASDAVTYATKAQEKAPTDIMPWLAKEKYSFTVISKENFDILVKDKNVKLYKEFLQTVLPGKF